MDVVLLDTDVFSFLMRRGDTRADQYRPHLQGKTVTLTFVSVGELYEWAAKRSWTANTLSAFEERLKAIVILPYDLELCREYARVKVSLSKGRVVPANDLWIAACAIRHSLPLLSHNRKHFEGIARLRLISEKAAE